MKQVECEFEADVLAAALQSRWPDQVDAELRAHVAQCPICSDVVTITCAVDDARDGNARPGRGSRFRPWCGGSLSFVRAAKLPKPRAVPSRPLS